MKRLLFIAAGLVALVLVITKWPTPEMATAPQQPSLHTENFARDLFSRYAWRTHEISYGHIHFLGSSYAARTSREIAQRTETARAVALEFLELQDTFPIEVFLVDSRQHMQDLVGRPIGGMVQSGERSALLVYNANYTPFLVHELTHLFTHYHWGPPRNGRWISEGIAALASGNCQGHTIPTLVKGLYEDNRIHPWVRLIEDFDTIDEISGNLQAASMVDFIRQRGGIRAVRELWLSEHVSEGGARTFGSNVAGIENEWLAAVRAHPASARLDFPTLRDRGCQ